MTDLLPTRRLGPRDAPATVVLLHGVGFGPATFAAVADHLARSLSVLVLARPGYQLEPSTGRRTLPAPDLTEQTTMITATVDAHTEPDAPLVLAGASGGATLGLALAAGAPLRWHAVVLHEPLVGPDASDLHAIVSAAAQRLTAEPGPSGTAAFLAQLVGDAPWSALADAERAAALAGDATIRAEVPSFAAFAPSADALGSLHGRRLITTVGARSGPARRGAAAALATATGAEIVTVPDAGHLVQVEAPAQWAAIIERAAVRS